MSAPSFASGRSRTTPGVSRHPLIRQHGSALSTSFLANSDFVLPGCFGRLVAYFDSNLHVWVAARGEASDLRKAAALLEGVLQSAPWLDDIPQEAEYVEKIRFARGVGANDKDSIIQPNISDREVSPVLDFEAGELHC